MKQEDILEEGFAAGAQAVLVVAVPCPSLFLDVDPAAREKLEGCIADL